MHKAAALLGLALLATTALPGASAHGAPAILDVERLVLDDDTSDQYALYDGYDLTTLYVRDAYWAPFDQYGFIFRISLYGGYAALPVSLTDALHIDLAATTPDGTEHAFRFTTTDDATWEGDLPILETTLETEPGATNAQLQVFASLDDLNMTHGDALTGLRLASYAGSTLVDAAPGGSFLPVTGDLIELPGESRVVLDTVTAERPIGYTATTSEMEGDVLTIIAGNEITPVGQHVHLVFPDDLGGWQLTLPDAMAKSIDPGVDATFELPVAATGGQVLKFHMDSDLGGRETLYLYDGPEGPTVMADASELPPAGTDGDDGEDAPGASLALLTVGLVAIALAARRR
ncbi:MAG: hypothetical protein ACPGQL_07225 [Thermoplasmatota archaeon]